jgi:hypothetical protein
MRWVPYCLFFPVCIVGTVLRLKGMDIDAIYCVAYGTMIFAFWGSIK